MLSSILNTALSSLGFSALPGSFAFSLEKDSSDSFQHGPFIVGPATASKTGDLASVFQFIKSKRTAQELVYARTFVSRLKLLRHPGALQYLDSAENDSGIFLATERVSPLDPSASSPAAKLILLSDLLEFVHFLHKEAALAHGNIKTSSLLVNVDGIVKLGGFFETESLKNYNRQVPQVRNTPPGVVADLVDLTGVAEELLGANFPESWRTASRDFLASRLDGDGYCQVLLAFISENKSVQIVKFLRNINLHRDAIDRLANLNISDLPVDIRKGPVVAALAKVLDVPSLAAAAAGVLTKVSQDFEVSEFKLRLFPLFVKLAAMPDRGVRFNLLVGVSGFVNFLDRKDFEKSMFIDLSSGFTDSHPVIREHTVHASIYFAKKLKPNTISSKLLPHLARLLSDSEGLVRAASMRVIGAIVAEVTDLEGRVEILIQAVIAGLKDTYGTTRVAAVEAVAKCLPAFSERDVAMALLPSLTPHLVDQEISVAVFDIVVKLVEKFRPGVDAARASQAAKPAAVHAPAPDLWNAQFPSPTAGLSAAPAVTGSGPTKLAPSGRGSVTSIASATSAASGSSVTARVPVVAPAKPVPVAVPSLKDLDEDFWAELDKPSR